MDTKPNNLDSEFAGAIIKHMSRINVRLFRATNGRLGGKWRVGAAFPWGIPICLLTHTGRKSGRVLTTPLVYLRDGGDIIVVASQAGRADDPQWYRNVVANPEVGVELRGEKLTMTARTADAAERGRLWPLLVDLYADYDSYQSWCPREIPVVICSPRSA
jgi:deazaflavin-dependent oxidoreductase (nitroreductase family)